MSNNTNPTVAGGKKIVNGFWESCQQNANKFQVFTGGSGKAGRHVIPYLLSKGHKVLNLDLVPFPDPSADVYTLKTDLTDSGQVFNALTSHFNMSGYSDGPVPGPPDVVIHFAGKYSSSWHHR
jgi:nucleoside-diphosphate-sugar epimerase